MENPTHFSDLLFREDLSLLLGVPLGLLLLLASGFALFLVFKRRRDAREFQEIRRSIEASPVATSEISTQSTSELGTSAGLQTQDAGTPHRTPMTDQEDRADRTPTVHKAAELDLIEEIRQSDEKNWLTRLRAGLSRTRQQFSTAVSGIFSGRQKLDESTLEQLHEMLFRADFGVKTTDTLVDAVRTELKAAEEVGWPLVKKILAERTQTILENAASKAVHVPQSGPFVVLVVGVNGVGKTTTIGKLAAHYRAAGKEVVLCAADTFRAAAIEQLQVWGQRTGAEVIRQQQGSDPAAVAFDAVKSAIARKADVLLIDTAGRLHNKEGLMAELAKINRIVGKDLPGAPHETWLVIDATTGQNAVQQVRAFRDVVALTGLVVTKLDGTAKGGVVVGIVDQFQLPIRWIGVGEKAADLRPFSGQAFAEEMFHED
jgi:fused signal recognition particle receptor